MAWGCFIAKSGDLKEDFLGNFGNISYLVIFKIKLSEGWHDFKIERLFDTIVTVKGITYSNSFLDVSYKGNGFPSFIKIDHTQVVA